MIVAKGINSVVAIKQPLYLITTRHVPPTYFGAVPPRHLTEQTEAEGVADPGTLVSTVFAFKDRSLAHDIALGLEHHRATRGVYPNLDVEELDLEAPGGAVLRELDIREASVPEVLRLVGASGLAVSVMYRDGGDGSSCRSVDVRPTRGVDRSWLETMFETCALLPKPKRQQRDTARDTARDAARDPVTNPARSRTDDFFAKMLLAIWMLLAAVVI
jgi:hypothetical protein